MASVNIIIVAAGSGLRFGAPLPKQFCILGDRPVLMHTIDALRTALPDAALTLVINRDMEQIWKNLCQEYSFVTPIIVYGGATRWESVKNAIEASSGAEIFMIHDGVRPLVTAELVSRLSSSLLENKTVDGVIPAIAVTDSLRQITSGDHSVTVDRSAMRAVQTPQAFPADKLRKAYSMPYCDKFTDDASVMEAAGFDQIILTEGSPENIKITNPGDIAVAEIYLKQRAQK